jgi:hypothetical protein
MHEGLLGKWDAFHLNEKPLQRDLLNTSLRTVLDLWKSNPDSEEFFDKMAKLLDALNRSKTPLILKVKAEALKNQQFTDFGVIENGLWVCDISAHRLHFHAMHATNRRSVILANHEKGMDIFFPEEIDSIMIKDAKSLKSS